MKKKVKYSRELLTNVALMLISLAAFFYGLTSSPAFVATAPVITVVLLVVVLVDVGLHYFYSQSKNNNETRRAS